MNLDQNLDRQIETRLLVVAEILERAVDEVRRVLDEVRTEVGPHEQVASERNPGATHGQ